MKKLFLVLLLIGSVGFTVAVGVKRRFYVYASPETESIFFKVFDVKSQIKPYVRQQCLSWRSDGGQSGWRTASHVREFHENVVIKNTEWMLFTTTLKQALSAQLSVNGTHIIHSFGDAETDFGFDYAEGNTLGTVTVYPAKVAADCLNCASVASDEAAVTLDVFMHEQRYDGKLTAAIVEKFVRDRTFEKMASREEDTSLVGDFSHSTSSHNIACADVTRSKLLEKGITVSQDPKDPTQVAVNYPDDYFKK